MRERKKERDLRHHKGVGRRGSDNARYWEVMDEFIVKSCVHARARVLFYFICNATGREHKKYVYVYIKKEKKVHAYMAVKK